MRLLRAVVCSVAVTSVLASPACRGTQRPSTDKAVSFHGATFRVPTGWPVDHNACTGTFEPTVLVAKIFSPGCPAPEPQNHTLLTLTCASSPTGFAPSDLKPATLNGEPVEVLRRAIPGLLTEPAGAFFVVPRLNLVIGASGPLAVTAAHTFKAPVRTPSSAVLSEGC